jgi:tRNA uridine 5-carboxymethylaminomethyl modification enzyme
MPQFDLIVIGSGHAGIEASHIAAKMGASVLLLTANPDFIGQMSCNPAIGGVAKGNIVREIDALGGLMGALIDRAGIHFRMLNVGKGSAVWGPRAQADKVAYRILARKALESCPNISILQAMAVGLGVSGGRVASVTLDNGEIVSAGAVVVAAGTFLNGVIHVGMRSRSGGRSGEPPSSGLTESIRELGISSGRLKTGTPPRIDGRTVDYSKLAVQRGDEEPWPFSFFTDWKLRNRVVCWSVKTNKETHKHILESLDRSPLYTGKISSVGPRYCPSIEDKVVRFGERDGHTLYLEPESLGNCELYINGMSTSLPYDVQERMVASIEGLRGARIMRPGYAIEYDYFQPLQLRPTLESKIVGGLFFAGQVNGTSGYEEAAGQGLLAGINAVQALRGAEPLVLGRDAAYIGVLVDDLVTKGTEEPYRMFTSRAEYRLILRQDNCDERLIPAAFRLGTVSAERYDERRRFWDRKREVAEALGSVRVTPEEYEGATGLAIGKSENARDLLRRPELGIGGLARGVAAVGELLGSDRHLALGVESDIKYEGFVRKQAREIERVRRYEETKIPDDFCYDDVPGLLTESRQKFKKIRPGTLGGASRISGVTPADVSVLAMYVLKQK